MAKRTNHIAVYIAAGKLIAMVLNFVTPLFLTRFLSKGDYGLYSQFITVFLFLGSIFGMGIQSNLYFFYTSAKTEQEKGLLITNTFILQILTTTIGLLLLLIPSVSNWLLGGKELQQYVVIIVITTWLYVPTRILDPLFTLRKDGYASMLFPPIETIGKVLLIVVSVLAFKDIRSILWSICLFQLGCFIYARFYSSQSGMSFRHYKYDGTMIRKILAYSLPFGFSVIINTLSSRLDKLICISYLTTEQYAVYTLAFFGIPGIMQVYDALCQVNVMDMSKAYHENNREVVLSLYRTFVVKTLSFSLPFILIVSVFAEPIVVLLFTDKYLESVPFFQVYILTFIVAMLGAGTILRAINKTRMSLNAYAISAVFFIPATYILIRQFGMWGAMGGALIGNILPRLLQIIIEMRQMHCSLKEYFPLKQMSLVLLIGLGLITPVFLLNHYFDFNYFVSCIIGCIYIFIAYLLEVKCQLMANPLQLVVDKIRKKNE